MAVTSPLNRTDTYGTGAVSVFQFPYYFLQNADLQVWLTDYTTVAAGVPTLLVYGTDYTVAGAGNVLGGSITLLGAPTSLVLPVPPTSTQKISIIRSPALTQELILPGSGPLNTASIVTEFDNLEMQIQALAAKYGDNPFPSTSLAAQIAAIQLALTGIMAGITAGWTLVTTVNVMQFGADPTGVTDSTAAFTAAKNALPFGGIITVPNQGIYAMNLVLDSSWNGITIQGPGICSGNIAPTTGYFKPFNTALPVIQVGTGTAGSLLTAGVVLRDICFFGNNTGQYGLVFAGGAYRNLAENIQSFNFTTKCLSFTCTPNVTLSLGVPCSYNKIRGLTISTSVAGADGVYMEDSATAPDSYAYTTANTLTDVDITSNGGYQVHVNSANGNFISNAYIQQAYSGLGVYLQQGYNRAPMLFTENTIMDNAAGSLATNMIVDNGCDWQNTQTYNSIPIQGNLQTTGYTFITAKKTTGNITSGTNSLTLASLAGVYVNRAVLVAGAGPSGQPLVGWISTLTGSVATLVTTLGGSTALNASTTVTGGATMIGDNLVSMIFLQQGNNSLSGDSLYLNSAKLTQLPFGGAKGQLFRAGHGSFEPLNSQGPTWDLGSNPHYYLQDDGYSSQIAAIVQTGTTVTVSTWAGNSMALGDLLQLQGATQPGINGTWPVASRVSNQAATFTSNVSQTLGAQITGTIAGTVLTLTANNTFGTIGIGSPLAGVGVTAGTSIVSLASGTAGQTGATYNLSASSTVGVAQTMYAGAQAPSATFTASTATNVLTLTSAATGAFAIGQLLVGVGIAVPTTITGLLSGTLGANGSTYSLSTTPGTVASEGMCSNGIIYHNNKMSSWTYGNLELGFSLQMKDENGNWTSVLQQNLNNGNFTIQTPDVTGGGMIFGAGSTATTGNQFVWAGGGITGMGLSGYGTLRVTRGVTGGAYTTAQRNGFSGMTAADIGMCVYDTTLAYPVWLHSQTGPVWHNASGAAV